MTRANKGAARRKAKKRWFEKAKGNRLGRSKHWRSVKEAVIRAGVNQYKDRRLVKRDYRQLWIIRVNAACRERGINYSRFINGLKHASIDLNRKMLSEIAIHDPAAFDALVKTAKAASPQLQAA